MHFLLSLFVSFAHLEFPCKFLYLWGYSAVSELSPVVLSGGGRCHFCCARHFRSANITSFIPISRDLAPFEILTWKVIPQKCLFQRSAPVHLRAPARSRIVNPTSRVFSWDSVKWNPGNVACPSKTATIIIFIDVCIWGQRMMDDQTKAFQFRRKIVEANRITQVIENV
jgi:hypothetical protein